MGATKQAKATYAEIAVWVSIHQGFVPKTCWIAHCKELAGLKPEVSRHRPDPSVRRVPCPKSKQPAIFAAFRHFGMLDDQDDATGDGG